MMKCALIRLVSYAEKNCRKIAKKVYEFLRNSRRIVAVTPASPKAVVVASMLC